MATKEHKVRKKQERSLRRINKRIQKDKEYMDIANEYSKGISFGRQRTKGRGFICDMRYSDCELRGYCNGDC